MIKRKGVKKSARDVINGMRKLFGSFPLLNIIIELMNNNMNINTNRIITLIVIIVIIRIGFTI